MLNEQLQFTSIGFAFDLDGTLVDTEKYKSLCHNETIKYYGGNAPSGVYFNFTGNSFDFVFGKLTLYLPVSISLEEYEKTFNDFYLKILQERKIIPEDGALKLLEKISSYGIKMALVTSSTKWMTDLVIKKAGISNFFDFFVSGDDVKNNKPAPDPYLLAIELLQSVITFAFEDTMPGIQSAKSAGAIVFGVRNKYNKLESLTQSSEILTSLSYFDLDKLLEKYTKL